MGRKKKEGENPDITEEELLANEPADEYTDDQTKDSLDEAVEEEEIEAFEEGEEEPAPEPTPIPDADRPVGTQDSIYGPGNPAKHP